jgi:hypothetical protein
MVDEIALSAVAKEALAFAWVVDHVLSESLADDETDEWFGAVIDRLVSRSTRGEADKVSRADFLSRLPMTAVPRPDST